jgi:Fur family ferric uptake transcriptional regulator
MKINILLKLKLSINKEEFLLNSDEKLVSKGWRNTMQKNRILNCLIEHKNQHITAEEIMDIQKQKGTPVGKATVYRFLKQLENEGYVKKYSITEGISACYQYLGNDSLCNEHYHLMCNLCGDVIHFESSIIGEFVNSIYKENGFLIDERKTVFYGTCRACSTK